MLHDTGWMPDTDPNTPNDTPSRRKRLLVRSAKALLAAAGLICLQWLGDAVVAQTGWPVPGALVGLLLLLGGLVVWGRVPPALDDVSTPLLRHLMLLLIPSVAAVGLYAGLVVQHAAVFLLVSTVVTVLTLGLTAYSLQRLTKREAE